MNVRKLIGGGCLAFWPVLAMAAPPAVSTAGGRATSPQTVERTQEVVEQGVYTELSESEDGTAYVIVMLQPVQAGRATPQQRRAAVKEIQERVLAELALDEFRIVYQYENFAAMTGRVNAGGLAKLAAHRDVVAVGPDGRGHGHLDVSVPFINADDVHALGYTGDGITVAVLDTGIDNTHADLSDNIAAGWYHFLDQGANVGPGAADNNGHGTNVSGIITSKGVVASVGVAPDADILAIKVLGAGGAGSVTDWAAGVDYVVTHKDDYDKLCAINMSLGTDLLYSACPCDMENTYTELLQASLQAAKNAGIVTFASSGNKGSCTSMSSPACLSAATAVAAVYDQNLGREPNSGTYQDAYGTSFGDCYDATTAGDKITCFSNRSGCNELAAPGRNITAPGMGGGLSTYTGTSQAAPHATGVAALMCQKCVETAGSLTPGAMVQTMKSTGVATNDPCSTSPNPIRVDALSAINTTCGGDDMETKWEQLPDLVRLSGMAVHATSGQYYTPHVLADDFECIVTGPLVEIDIWGGWSSDNYPLGDPSNVSFRLSIHDDIPADQNPPDYYSIPGDLLWSREFGLDEFEVELYESDLELWWYVPCPGGQAIWPQVYTSWLYKFFLDPTEFWQEGTLDAPITYWLDVQAYPMEEYRHFGWNTSVDHWNDDAVCGEQQDPPAHWYEMDYPGLHELPEDAPFDMAFRIIGEAALFNAPALPTDPEHQVRKNRYISIDPRTNPTVDTVIKVEVAEMRRCEKAPTRGCETDSDCDPVCDDIASVGVVPNYYAYQLLCPPVGGNDCSLTNPPSLCLNDPLVPNSGPCVDLAPTFNPPLAWVVQQPIQDPTGGCKKPGCPPYPAPPAPQNCCEDDDWMSYLGPTVPPLTGGYTSWSDVWAALPAGVLHIAGCPIVPVVTYAVYACDPNNLYACSEPLMVGTQRFPVNDRPVAYHLYADVCGGVVMPGPTVLPPDHFVNVTDLFIEQLTLVNYGSTRLPQMHPTWADLHGPGWGIPPNYNLNVSDLMAVYVMSLKNSWPYVNSQGGLDPQFCEDTIVP